MMPANAAPILAIDGEEMDDWIETLSVRRATADLMEAARQDRWTPFKRLHGGVYGTPAEYEARPSNGARNSSRAVLPRDLLTPEERATLRRQMQQATPEERYAPRCCTRNSPCWSNGRRPAGWPWSSLACGPMARSILTKFMPTDRSG